MSSLIRQIATLCRRTVRAETARIHTMTVGRVEEYDATENKVKVTLCVRRIRTEDPENMTTTEVGILEDVPVKHRGSGKLVDTMPPAVGSYGEIRFSDRDLEAWLVAGGIVDPSNTRRFDLSDAIFDPGVYPFVDDGDNGMLAEPVKADRSSKRTRSGLTEISVLADESVFINVNDGKGTASIDKEGNLSIAINGDKCTVGIDKDGNVSIATKGDLTATADGDVSISADGDVIIDGANVSVTGALDVNGNFTVDE